jgi:hypothetical protein
MPVGRATGPRQKKKSKFNSIEPPHHYILSNLMCWANNKQLNWHPLVYHYYNPPSFVNGHHPTPTKPGSRTLPTTQPNTETPASYVSKPSTRTPCRGVLTSNNFGFPLFPKPSLLAEPEDENENSHRWYSPVGYVVLSVPYVERYGLEDKSIKVLPVALVRGGDRNTPFLPVFEETYAHGRC